MFYDILFSQNIIDNYVHIGSSTIIRGSSSDGLKVPRDLDFHKDPQRDGELWVINETSAVFDGSNGGSTVTFYNAGSNSQWAEYRKDAFSAHFMHTASAIAFSDNGGFANALDVQDANNTPGGYFSGSTLWDSDTSIYARIHQISNKYYLFGLQYLCCRGFDVSYTSDCPALVHFAGFCHKVKCQSPRV